MATKLAMTVAVNATDIQRWTCRTHLFQFIGASFRAGLEPRSWDPLEQVDELAAHHLPAVAGAAELAILVRLEARLHDGQERALCLWREREGHDGLEKRDAPRVAEFPMRLDLAHPAVHDAVPARVW